MHVPATLATLALCLAALGALRLRWRGLSYAVQRALVLTALLLGGLVAVAFALRLSTTSNLCNAAAYWVFVLSYLFLLVLFTLLRPRGLTMLVALVLMLPLLSASAFLPLTAVFSHLPHRVEPLGDGYISDLLPIDAVTAGASGADLTVYRRLAWAPFLQRRFMGTRYFNTQCDTRSAYAVLQPDHLRVLMVCPPSPNQPADSGRSIVLKLYP